MHVSEVTKSNFRPYSSQNYHLMNTENVSDNIELGLRGSWIIRSLVCK